MKMTKKLLKRLCALALVVSASVAVDGGAFAHSYALSKDTPTTNATQTVQGESALDYFDFPDVVQKTGTVGEKTAIARITPSDVLARDYTYQVFSTATGEMMALDGYSFFPKAEGKYKCLYYYQTSTGKKIEYFYELNVTAKDGPVFSQTPNFPYAFLAGNTYQIPMIEAADWSNGTKRNANVQVSVSVAGQNLSVAADGSVKIDSDGPSEAEVAYTATLDGKVNTYKVNVPVLDNRKTIIENGKEKQGVDMAAMFVTRNFEGSSVYNVDEKAEGIIFNAFEDAELKFANVLGSNGMSVSFGFGEKCNAESIIYRIESYYDPSVYLTVELNKGKKAEGAGEMILNGTQRINYTFKKSEVFDLILNESCYQLFNIKSGLFPIKKDANGGEFKGFPGGKVKISLDLKGVYGETELIVYKINNQKLGGDKDNRDPDVYLEDTVMEYYVGDEIRLFNRFAVDVIDPCATLETTLYDGDTEIVNDINGKPIVNIPDQEEVVFKAQKAGVYMVSCKMTDSSGRMATRIRVLYIYDKTAPTITMAGEVPSTVALNGKLSLPAATADDNSGQENVDLNVCIIYPSGRMLVINLGKGSVDKFDYTEIDEIGTYYVRYIANDFDYNTTVKEFKVTCGG